MNRGTVFHHTNFKFKDGEMGSKLIVILNQRSGADPFLCCKTTSKIKFGMDKEGCYHTRNIHVIKKPPFNVMTWVQFDPVSVFEFSVEQLLNDCLQHKYIQVIGILDEPDINAIVNCFKKSEDISGYHIQLLNKK